ncbi:peptidyl-prolyl cis-trans isomerase C [Gammaproteobacteria bacterium]
MYIKSKMFFNSMILGASLVGISLQAIAEANQEPVDTVLVVVNGNPITQSTYDRILAGRPAGPNRDRKTVIDELIKRELVLQDAIKHGLDKKPEIITELATLRENLLVGADLKAVAETLSSSDAELQKFYTAHLKEMITTEYKARHILLATSDEATAIIGELDKGADFSKLAKEKSKDNAAEGGDLGWFNSGQMVKPFSEAVATLQKGKYTDKPVQSEFGWHVILLEDVRETPPPSFDKVKDRIKMAMQRTKLQEYIQNLRNEAKIEIKDKD